MAAPFLGRRPTDPRPRALSLHGILGCACGRSDACALDGDTRTQLAHSDTAIRHRSDTSGSRTMRAERPEPMRGFRQTGRGSRSAIPPPAGGWRYGRQRGAARCA
ncbi:hypothetical protein GCM10010217_44430 [Streptomyces tubercidicus]